jgi:hypothetical protein
MILPIYELGMKALGYRQCGTIERPTIYDTLTGGQKFSTPRPIYKGKIELPDDPIYIGGYLNLSGNHHIDQGDTSACACATICAMLEDWIIRTEKNQNIWIDWRAMWEDMKFSEWASEEKGSYLQDNIHYLQQIGIRDNYGRLWKTDGMERISKLNVMDYLERGHEIYTGALIDIPMTDSKYYFKGIGNAGGHAFRLIGWKTINGIKVILAETTWKRYGYKKESYFFITPERINDLFSCYVMTFKHVS